MSFARSGRVAKIVPSRGCRAEGAGGHCRWCAASRSADSRCPWCGTRRRAPATPS